MSHTPGPWRRVGHEVWGANDTLVVAQGDAFRADAPEIYKIDTANARLIAAAPEMLAALENCRDVLEDYEHITPFHQALEQAIAVIAKVKVKNQPPDLTAGEFNRGE